MIFHYMKDGTQRDSVDGYIVKYEQKKELYKRITNLHKRGKGYNGNNNTGKNFGKE